MKLTKIGLAATTVAVGLLVFGGSTLASAATPTPSPSASSGTTPGGAQGEHGRGGPRGTEVTGDEATKAGAAVTAKDSAVTVEKVMKADDGTYRVFGTKDGERVAFHVSADLATVTEGKGRGGRGGPKGTEVTGDEATKAGAAVTAEDSAVTVEKVFKAEDGTYRVLGTKDGAKVMFEVSADLGTVTQHTARAGGDRGGKGHGGERPGTTPGSAAPSASAN